MAVVPIQRLFTGLKSSWIGAILLLASLPAMTAAAVPPECSHFLTYAQKQARVWDTVTRRHSGLIFNRLAIANRSSLKGVNGRLPPFDKEAVLNGSKSLLSLGEGLSSFVSFFLDADPRLRVHAVDMIYGDSEEFAVELQDAMIHFEVENLRRKYPGHYHAQYFQNLDIPGGRFDEVVSSHSLAYLFDVGRFDEDLELLRRILAAVKPGGVLRFWPIRPDLYPHMEKLARHLMSEGLIRNHNRGTPPRGRLAEPEAHAVVIFQTALDRP